MTNTSFRNFICIVGLVFGATLITGANLAHAEVRECNEQEVARITEDRGEPIFCDVITVGAQAPGSSQDEPDQFGFQEWLDRLSFTVVVPEPAQNQQVFLGAAS